MNQTEGDKFGSEAGLYTKMAKIGLYMFLGGGMVLLSGYFFHGYETLLYVMGIAFIFIGGMVGLTGYTGYRDEIKKFGKKRVYTGIGLASFLISIPGALAVGLVPLIALASAVVATVLGHMARKRGDNMYGEAGFYIGIIGIVTDVLVISMFYFFT